ncbi:Protein of unknown function [Pyronema omphalodes CBS 100304]|uniref:Uncharacterized protein n=1 Tax=Pyronema omphalodes (strain CBS 100304) TaxID=1076935 RepID=U4LDP1_PYROM|nr:Protein of unknown function [Pyronema omphalodes CBS 100304]
MDIRYLLPLKYDGPRYSCSLMSFDWTLGCELPAARVLQIVDYLSI